jgi:hypothetical protein
MKSQHLKKSFIRILNLPFDSFGIEAHDRLAQGGELVEPFRISYFGFPVYPG